ncbi:HAD domain-containing protein [Ralstonia pseudosolanacearum]|uniref:HAD domain-containing protein n=1 Tax=Ralstonia pseudosolanacearum TaxID=1310165 RepID=UPI003CEE259E
MVDVYLNYDGVLHPNRVSYSDGSEGRLQVGGHTLFEHNARLVELLHDRDAVRIVLNTWWVYAFGVERAVCCLPRFLQERVDDSTLRFHDSYPEGQVPDRYEATKEMSCKRVRAQVLILDSTDSRWPACWLPRCLLLHPFIGLGDEHVSGAFWRLLARIQRSESEGAGNQAPACGRMPESSLSSSSSREGL